MSHMSRKEILDLLAQFQLQCDKIEKHQGFPLPLAVGLNIVGAELARNPEGLPSLTLRNLGRLLKHYTEEVKKKPNAVIEFNVAASWVQKGGDVQQAIRQAKRGVKTSVDTMESEGYCDAKTHTHLRVNKHDRALQAILES